MGTRMILTKGLKFEFFHCAKLYNNDIRTVLMITFPKTKKNG